MKHSALFLLLALNACFAAAQQPATASIQERMSPEQFKAAGLDKLDESELKQLNAWVAGEKMIVVKKMTEAGALTPKPSTDDVNSRLVGDFNGWRGNTRFILENNQVWEQADNSELFAKKIQNPKVRIAYSGFSGWKLQVEGYNSWVKVKRVK